MKPGTFLYAAFAVVFSAIFWAMWDRSLHFNLWIDYLSPCLFPAVILLGFVAEYRRSSGDGLEADKGLSAFLKRSKMAYAGFVGLSAVLLWWREDFEVVPYILFFGMPYFLGCFFVSIAVMGVLYAFRKGTKPLFGWLWVGFVIYCLASLLALAGGAWTGIAFLFLAWEPLLSGGQRIVTLLGRSTPILCLVGAVMTLVYWHLSWVWQVPWHVRRIPYNLIPAVVVAGVLLWAVYKYNDGRIRQAAVIAGKTLASFAVVTVLMFACSGFWHYVGEELTWLEEFRYKVIFEAESNGVIKRAESVLSVERKALNIGRVPAGRTRLRGSLPAIKDPGHGVWDARLAMDQFWLKGLPKVACAAIKKVTGDDIVLTAAPVELVGQARPRIEGLGQFEKGPSRLLEYHDADTGITFRAWVQVLGGMRNLEDMVIVLPESARLN